MQRQGLSRLSMGHLTVVCIFAKFYRIVFPRMGTSIHYSKYFILPKTLRNTGFYLILLLILNISHVNNVCADDRPFNNSANWGGTGLLEIPTARVLNDGVVRVGYAQALPYSWIAGGMGIFPGLEASGRYTKISNIDSNLGPDFGAVKDKAFDLKYQLFPESKWMPAIALGLNDIQGTQLFEAQYLAFNRQIYPLDFTVGIGTKRLEGLFGGIEWAITEKIHLLAEYSPIDYAKDHKSARGVPEGADSPINLGVRMEIFPGIDIGASYQRGNTFGFMCHFQAKLGKPILPKKPDPPLWVPMYRRPFAQINAEDMVAQIKNAIMEAGFLDVSVYTSGKALTAEFENNKYISNQKAAGRALRILLYQSPRDTENLSVILKRNQIPFLKVSVKPDHFDEYLLGNISDEVLSELVTAETISASQYSKKQDLIITEKSKSFDYQFGIKPDLTAYLNDPSGVFKFRVGIKPYFEKSLGKGTSFYTRYTIPFYSNISSSNPPLPDAVRSDSWLYLDNYPTFDRLMLDHTFKLSQQTFARLSYGYLEFMYAGVSTEILKFFGDGNLALGIEGNWVRKREPDTQLGLKDFTTHTILGNLYYKFQPFNLTFKVQYGRFMAGDIGWRFQLSREYDNGLEIGAWYSLTDTDDLTAYNKGYNDKGVFMKLPARVFSNYETRTKYNYWITPWTRDVAATVLHWKNLFDMGSDLMPAEFKSDMKHLKK